MLQNLKSAATRLAFSLLALSALGGCAVYAPAPDPYSYHGTDAYGQAVYAPPPAYPVPHYYGPAYMGPPVFWNFGLGYWSGGGRGGPHGGRGHHGGGRR